MKNVGNNLSVIDFFCWAWGFSEGFRQQWFDVIQWLDFWQPAIDTHNLNHNLNDETKNILDFWSVDSSNISEINKLEDTQIIIGSPSCVSFSTSNKSWKADKSLWIQLIEAYLRVIAVKKHQKDSKLLAWYMENVPNSQNHVSLTYSFEALNLWKWAKSIWKKPSDLALKVKNNGDVFNSWDFGAPQSRKRFIAWEFCETWEFLLPKKTHENHISLGSILQKLPKANTEKQKIEKKYFVDPNYSNLKVSWKKITDQFYDNGLYKIEWERAEDLKVNNYCMGKMSFPENLEKPCRTIMATRSARMRESIILKSEYSRTWNWEYRLPTIREISTFMGFPIVYQFTWTESSKWRQVGNSVSPHLSSALAKAIRNKLWLGIIEKIDFNELKNNYSRVENLNTFQEQIFNKPKTRQKDARFRRPILKKNNITVDLLNFDEHTEVWKGWFVKAYFWTGENYKHINIEKNHILELEKILEEELEDFTQYKKELNKFLEENIGGIETGKLQSIYEEDLSIENSKNPINIRNSLNKFIQKYTISDDLIQGVNFIPKNEIPKSQLLTMYNLGNLIFN